jgi:hypothetical protein
MKASGKRNYDYVALQATDNSIPFYESLGFVRVGAITEDDKFEEKQANLKCDNYESPSEGNESPSQGSPHLDTTPEIVSSAVQTYVTEKPWVTPADIAKKFNVDVWDIIFLNHFVFENIQASSRLMKGTSLFVPSVEEAKADATSHASRSQDLKAASAPQWYIASENDTPRMIAKQFGVSCSELVAANRDRLSELQGISRLKEGTRIKVSHFHVDDDKHVPYCHWTFPDDSFEHTEPSYMMVRELERRKGAAAKHRPVEASLAVPITQYTAPTPELFKSVQAPPTHASAKTPKKKSPVLAGGPTKPKRPLTGYMIYCSEQREAIKDELAKLHGKEVIKVVSKMWQELSERDKAAYQEKAQMDQTRYQKAMEKYKQDLATFHRAHPKQALLELADPEPKSAGVDKNSLFNKVVKLNEEGSAQSGSEYEYFFVLTYIPDLHWCHLAPMVRVGNWGPDKPQAEGRPIWMLVNENEGKEVDISSTFCVPVKSRSMKRTVDADREQWDILESEPSKHDYKLAAIFTNRVGTKSKAMSNASHSAMKPLSGSIEPKRKRGRPRKHPPPVSVTQTPREYMDPTQKRGRPRSDPLSPSAVATHSTSKAPTGSTRPKEKLCIQHKNPLVRKAVQSLSAPRVYTDPTQKRGRPRKYPLPDSATEPRKTAGTRKIGSDTDYTEWNPETLTPAQAHSSRRSLLATKPLTGTIERKKKGGQPRKPPLLTDTAATEDENWEPEAEKPPAPGRVQPARQSHSAMKPLTGSIEPKTTKRERACKNPAPTDGAQSLASAEPVNGSTVPKKKLRKPRRHPSLCAVVSVEDSDEAEFPPTKRRKLPHRNVPPVFYGSPRSLNGSAVKATPVTTRKTPVRARSGNRKEALTRSGKKLSMTSPLMFAPRVGARG